MKKIICLVFLGIVSVSYGQIVEAKSDLLVQYEQVGKNEWILINEANVFTDFHFDFTQKTATESSENGKRNYEIIEFQKLKDGNYVVGLRQPGEADRAVYIDFKLNTITSLPRTNDTDKIKNEYSISEFVNK